MRSRTNRDLGNALCKRVNRHSLIGLPETLYCCMVRYLVLYQTPTDEAAFEKHYREVHVPLAKSLPGVRRYAVSRSVDRVRGEPFYMVAELDFDDGESIKAAFQSEIGQATARDVIENLQPLSPDVRSMVLELEEL